MDIVETIKYLNLYIYNFFLTHKIKSNAISNALIGVGSGVVANVMFVITTSDNYNGLRLTISFVLAIIILLVGSTERSDGGQSN